MPLLLELAELDLELAFQQCFGGIDACLEDIAHAEEMRLVVAGLGTADDHARGGIELHLTVCEDVELLDHLVRRCPLREVNEDFHLVGGVVVDVLDLDLALRVRGEDRVDEGARRHAEGQLGDREEVFRAFLDFRAHFYFPAALAVVVIGEIGGAAGGEVRQDAEIFPLQMIDRCAADVVEIVRQDFCGEADRDAVRAFEQDDGKFRGQCDGLLVAAVVAELPGRRLRVEEHILRERREARLDVARGRGVVAGEDVPEISLRLDEPAALGDADEGGADGGIAVGVQLHRRADDICDFVEAPVVHVPQRVEHAALHRFQAVVHVRDRAIEDDVAGVFEEPVAIMRRDGRFLLLDFSRADGRGGNFRGGGGGFAVR